MALKPLKASKQNRKSLEQQTKEWLRDRSNLSLAQQTQEYLKHHQSVLEKRASYARQGILVSYRQEAPQLQYLPKVLQEQVQKHLSP